MPNEFISNEQRPAGHVDRNKEDDRGTVEAMFRQYWGEQCVSLYVPHYNPKYEVEGLRADGSALGENPASWAFQRTITRIFGVINEREGGYQYAKSGANTLGNGSVNGAPDSVAVRIAQSTNPGTKWLAWSTNHVALFDYDWAKERSGQVGVRWHAWAPDLPRYERHPNGGDISLHWPDNSSLSFKLTIREDYRLKSVEKGQQPTDYNQTLNRWLGKS